MSNEIQSTQPVPTALEAAIRAEPTELIAKWRVLELLAATPQQPAQAPVLSEADLPPMPDCLLGVGSIGKQDARRLLQDYARAILSTNPKSEPAAASSAPAPEEPGSWAQYVAWMVVAYLGGGVDDERIKPIAGIIERRLRALAPSTQAPAAAHEPAAPTAEQPAAEVAWLWREKRQDLYPGPSITLTEAGEALPLGVKHKLYAAPQPASSDGDARDAARYRWLRARCQDLGHSAMTIAQVGMFGLTPWCGDDPDREIDAAMSAAAKEAK